MAEPAHAAPSAAERLATGNPAAFRLWLRAVHGILLPKDDTAIRDWATTDPAAAGLILGFAGEGFVSARIAAGLLLDADLRPDDRILVLGPEPPWLSQALVATRGLAAHPGAATLLIADVAPASLPPSLRRIILTGPGEATPPPGVTLSRAADWTYPSESSAD